jgi:hypothetical protein
VERGTRCGSRPQRVIRPSPQARGKPKCMVFCQRLQGGRGMVRCGGQVRLLRIAISTTMAVAGGGVMWRVLMWQQLQGPSLCGEQRAHMVQVADVHSGRMRKPRAGWAASQW